MKISVINLEEGMPTLREAETRLENAIRSEGLRGTSVIKIIHGYGSSGVGGTIKSGVIRRLSAKKRSGAIKNFVTGERFSPFEADARAIIDVCPKLSGDKDYTRSNEGITIVLL